MSYQQPAQPGYGQQPGWGQQPPPKKNPAGKIIGFGCLGIVGLIVVIAIIGAIVGSSGDSSTDDTSKPAATAGDAKPGKDDAKADEPKEAPAKKAPVVVTAKVVEFKKSILADGDDYTSVQVTLTNNGDKDLDVNPLYFTVTDTGGSKHTAELGVDEDQMEVVKLAPGENVTGTITGKGSYTAKYVTYTDGLLGDSVRGDAS